MGLVEFLVPTEKLSDIVKDGYLQLMLDGFSGKHVKIFIDGVPQEGVGWGCSSS